MSDYMDTCMDCTCCNQCSGPDRDCHYSDALGDYTCPCSSE